MQPLCLDPHSFINDVGSGSAITDLRVFSGLVLADGGPRLGSVTISPSTGYALETEFFLSQSGWVDSNLPLSYAFSYQTVGNSATSFLRGFQSAGSMSNVVLPGVSE